MFVVGLTGGIGSGKSTVAALFAELGVPIIDADVIARELTTPATFAFSLIVKHFGQTILQPNGSLDRRKLRLLIFADTQQRLWLEQLLHPLILEAMQQQIAQLHTPYCIAVIPLLLEVASFSFINRILVVDTPEAEQIKRVSARDHLTPSEVDAILKTQTTREIRHAKAHDILSNDGSLEALITKVQQLHIQYLQMSET
jgi:dephospho-CoA kinase